ncbi:MAG: DUF3368 domain-containing protein, partial [Candidatus Micrarchaeia archaeon]
MIVCDSSPLILFARIRRLDLLFELFGTPLLVEETVRKEVVDAGLKEGFADAILLEECFKKGLIKSVKARGKKQIRGLHEGETASIALCLKHKNSLFLADEPLAREVAKAKGITTHGTLFVLWQNAKKKKISKKQAVNLLNKLLDAGYRLSARHYAQFIQKT